MTFPVATPTENPEAEIEIALPGDADVGFAPASVILCAYSDVELSATSAANANPSLLAVRVSDAEEDRIVSNGLHLSRELSREI